MGGDRMDLCYPVNYVYITNGYSNEHQAIDLGWRNSPDVPIYSCYSGVVTRSFFDNLGGGLTLTIKYDNGYISDFKHLSEVLVKIGDRVTQLQQVAVMGNTGWDTTGPHLHFNLSLNGSRVNPIEHCYIYPNQEVATKDKDKVKYYKGDDNMKFTIGNRVIVSGNLYANSNAKTASGKVENKVTTITRVASGTLHPYNTTGDLGWMNEKDIKLYEEPETNYQELYEIELAQNEKLQNQLQVANQKIKDAINVLQ